MSVDCYLIFCSPEQSDVLEAKPAVLKKLSLVSEADVYDETSISTSNLERRSHRSKIRQSDRYLAVQSNNSNEFTGTELGLETCIALQKKHGNQSERSLKEARVRYSSKCKESKEVFQSTELCQGKDTADDEIYNDYERINPVFTNNHEDSHGDEVIRTLHQISRQIKFNGINYEDK